MTDLDQLEALAKAALWTGDWNASCGTVDCAYPADSKLAGEFDEIAHPVPLGVSDYIAAAQPRAILELIAEVRTLREAEHLVSDYINALIQSDTSTAGDATARMVDFVFNRADIRKEPK